MLEAGEEDKAGQWDISINGFKDADYGVSASYPQLHIRREVGGGASVWGGWCTGMREIAMSRTDLEGYPQWPIDHAELLPFYSRAASFLKIADYEPSLIDAIAVENFDNLAVKAFRFSPPVRYPADFSNHVAKSEKIVLATGVTVLSLKGRDGHASAVEVSFNGQTHTLHCNKTIVLAAGAVGNARVLARSAMQLGIADAVASNIGKYFFEHPHCYSVAEVVFTPHLAAELAKQKYSSNGFVSLTPKKDFLIQNGLTDFNFQIHPIAVNKSDARTLSIAQNYRNIYGVEPQFYDATLGMEQAIHSQNFSVLDDGTLNRKNDGHLTLDLSGQKKIVAAAKKWLLTNGVHAWIAPPEQASIVAVGHLHGSTRMAREQDKGVTDANCRVFGLDNVYVAGSSVFPTGGYSNPTFTIVALATRLGDYLATKNI